MGDAYFKAAVRGTEVAVDLQARNPLFRALAWGFLLVVAYIATLVIRRLSTRIADAIFERWKGAS
jgi:hypothetical protein